MVPEIESNTVRKDIADRGYRVIGNTPVIDDTAAAFEDSVETIIRNTEMEITLKYLLDEMERENNVNMMIRTSSHSIYRLITSLG